MKCPSCSAIISDDARFCPLCGCRISQAAAPNPAQQLSAQPQQPPVYTAPQQADIYPGYVAQPTQGGVYPGYTAQPVQQEKPMPMKWFNFLIYFSLWAGAVINFISGINYLTGMIYESEGITADMIYEFYGMGLKVCDVLMGLACFGLAAFGIYVRFRLAQYRGDGPKLYIAMLAAVILITLIYSLAAMLATGINTFGEVLPELVIDLIILLCNRKYFRKRGHLFVN